MILEWNYVCLLASISVLSPMLFIIYLSISPNHVTICNMLVVSHDKLSIEVAIPKRKAETTETGDKMLLSFQHVILPDIGVDHIFTTMSETYLVGRSASSKTVTNISSDGGLFPKIVSVKVFALGTGHLSSAFQLNSCFNGLKAFKRISTLRQSGTAANALFLVSSYFY